jgi:L-asparaginase
MLPTVVILGTGGTIAGAASSAVSSSVYQAATLGVAQLLSAVPHLETLAQIECQQIAQKASYDISFEDWAALTLATNQALAREEVAGVVITHGTDTLEETAFLLHLTVTSDKPVVLCGAMRPATAYSADGPANLFNAVSVAVSSQARGRGAMVVMNERIHSARTVVKAHCASVLAFESRSFGEIGYVSDGHARFTLSAPSTARLTLPFNQPAVLKRVDIAYSYVGQDTHALQALLATKPAGLIYAGSGNGNSPTPAKRLLLQARQEGMALVRATRCFDGWITRNSAEFADDALGITTAHDLTPQKARILTMLALSNGVPADQLQALFDQVSPPA